MLVTFILNSDNGRATAKHTTSDFVFVCVMLMYKICCQVYYKENVYEGLANCDSIWRIWFETCMSAEQFKLKTILFCDVIYFNEMPINIIAHPVTRVELAEMNKKNKYLPELSPIAVLYLQNMLLIFDWLLEWRCGFHDCCGSEPTMDD